VGLNVGEGIRKASKAKAVYVTPSFQYPLGVSMSLPRRLELLDWARKTQSWIKEDDYQFELWYKGNSLASLHSLDTYDRVIYVGTFSNILFPALRLAYVVLPHSLILDFLKIRADDDLISSILEQAVLSGFIDQGHLGNHMRRMRALYKRRQGVLVEALQNNLGRLLRVGPAVAGFHINAWLPSKWNDVKITNLLMENGIVSNALSKFSIAYRIRPGLLLGYASLDEATIRIAVQRLGKILKSH